MWERLGTLEDYSRVVCTQTVLCFPEAVEGSIKTLNYDFWVTFLLLVVWLFPAKLPCSTASEEEQ